MSKDQGGKGGGARKIGRNKAKCSLRAKTKSKRPIVKGKSKRPEHVRMPFILDSCNTRVPEGRMSPAYRPMQAYPHVGTEYAHDAKHTRGEHKQFQYREYSESVVMKLMPHLKPRVLSVK